MKNAITVRGYAILELNEDGCTSEDGEIYVEQYKHDKLEYWKTRDSDGFHFVFCNRLEIGYWVHPDLVKIEESNQ